MTMSDIAADHVGSSTERYLEWAASEEFRTGIRRFELYGGTGATLLNVRQDRAIPDPPTADITIQLCTAGNLDLVSDVAGVRRSGLMRRGQFMVTPPNAPINLSGEGQFDFDVLVLDQSHLTSILAPQTGADENFARLFGRVLADSKVTALIAAMWDDIRTSRAAGRVYADVALAHLLHYLSGLGGAVPQKITGGLSPWQVRRATEALADADAAVMSLGEIAAHVGLSPFHFCRAFRQSVGLSPHRYQTALRIERARKLLSNSTLSVTEIAYLVGYGSSQAFARAFQREFGTSPSSYRADFY